MKNLKIILVDDEKRVRNSLTHIIKLHYPSAEVLAEAENIDEASRLITQLKPEVVLLDIKMPGGTGFELLNQLLPLSFKVIFVTAFDQFALKAFKYSAVDYLLKPVIPKDLVQALDHAREKINSEKENIRLKTLIGNLENKERKIVLNTHEATYVIPVNDIIRCEADRNYTHFFIKNKKTVLISGGLKEYDDMLNSDGFIRCHHSHLVNLKYIDRLEKKQGGFLILLDGSKIPVSTRKYTELSGVLNGL